MQIKPNKDKKQHIVPAKRFKMQGEFIQGDKY
jgi:hypothetical protein